MNKKLTIISLLIILSAFTNPINAISAGVSPPKIEITNAQPGNNYNLSFAVYNQGNETTDYSIEVKGNISNWTYVNITQVQVKGKSNYPISGLIRVPSNIPTGNYTGSILIKSVPSNDTTGNKVSVGVNLPITLNISSFPNTSIELSNNIPTNKSQNRKIPGFELVSVFIIITLLTLTQKHAKRK